MRSNRPSARPPSSRPRSTPSTRRSHPTNWSERERAVRGGAVGMPVTVRIPTQLRELSGGAAEVKAEGATLAAVLADLEVSHPGFRERLFDDQGELRRFVNVFVADEDIRFLDGVNTDVTDGATV